jgi:hypothetical protein
VRARCLRDKVLDILINSAAKDDFGSDVNSELNGNYNALEKQSKSEEPDKLPMRSGNAAGAQKK